MLSACSAPVETGKLFRINVKGPENTALNILYKNKTKNCGAHLYHSHLRKYFDEAPVDASITASFLGYVSTCCGPPETGIFAQSSKKNNST